MKRMLIVAAVAAAMGLVAQDSHAQGMGWGAPAQAAPFAPPQAAPAGPAGDRFGFNPVLRHMMWWKKDRCGPGCGGAPGGPAGTLVFPTNPYTRSPRDWFQN